MEEVDKLIKTLCDYITDLTKKECDNSETAVAENAKALAELITARARSKYESGLF